MFDLRTGQPETLPAVKPVPVYDVEVVDGTVRIVVGADAAETVEEAAE